MDLPNINIKTNSLPTPMHPAIDGGSARAYVNKTGVSKALVNKAEVREVSRDGVSKASVNKAGDVKNLKNFSKRSVSPLTPAKSPTIKLTTSLAKSPAVKPAVKPIKKPVRRNHKFLHLIFIFIFIAFQPMQAFALCTKQGDRLVYDKEIHKGFQGGEINPSLLNVGVGDPRECQDYYIDGDEKGKKLMASSIASILCLVQTVVTQGSFHVYCGILQYFVPISKILILVYVLLYSFNIILFDRKSIRECLKQAIFVIAVYYVFTNSEFFFEMMYKVFVGSLFQMDRILIGTSGGENIYERLDSVLKLFYNFDPMMEAVGVGTFVIMFLFASKILGVVIAILAFLGFFTAFSLFYKIIIGYMSAFMMMVFLMMFSPLFFTMFLFSRTRDIFFNWLGAIFGYAVQVVLLLLFLYIMGTSLSITGVFSEKLPEYLGYERAVFSPTAKAISFASVGATNEGSSGGTTYSGGGDISGLPQYKLSKNGHKIIHKFEYSGGKCKKVAGDLGGLTTDGITQATYDDYNRRNGKFQRSVCNLTEAERIEITQYYCEKSRACYIKNELVRNIFTDTSINWNPIYVCPFVKEVQQKAAPNSFSSSTCYLSESDIAEINALSPEESKKLARDLAVRRMNYRNFRVNEENGTQASFSCGWLRRDIYYFMLASRDGNYSLSQFSSDFESKSNSCNFLGGLGYVSSSEDLDNKINNYLNSSGLASASSAGSSSSSSSPSLGDVPILSSNGLKLSIPNIAPQFVNAQGEKFGASKLADTKTLVYILAFLFLVSIFKTIVEKPEKWKEIITIGLTRNTKKQIGVQGGLEAQQKDPTYNRPIDQSGGLNTVANSFKGAFDAFGKTTDGMQKFGKKMGEVGTTLRNNVQGIKKRKIPVVSENIKNAEDLFDKFVKEAEKYWQGSKLAEVIKMFGNSPASSFLQLIGYNVMESTRQLTKKRS